MEFVEARKPIVDAVTKFGGQPVWVAESQWSLSAATGEPMRFIGQIALAPELFGSTPARMAYIFMTDGEEYVDGTWEPDGGENAMILQGDEFPGPGFWKLLLQLDSARVPFSVNFGDSGIG